MNLRELINTLEELAAEHGEFTEVRLAMKSAGPLEYSIGNAGPDSPDSPQIVYISEGRRTGQLPAAVARRIFG